ncbi:MAG TPA: anthranilate synthase component I family protein [Acidimicrobiia bacterium]|nr:anthranilate synthase component I family protein [Acidimicrobiia bacterium]
MESIFDIPADLDTPVSAYLRLASLQPRYLLESVEGGHTGRYSFIGFGDTQRVTIEDDGVHRDGELLDSELLPGLRQALAGAPVCEPVHPSSPFDGGLVGVAAFDLVRRLYRLPEAPHGKSGPDGVYITTASILVFDHLTRRMALLHSGSEDERRQLRKHVREALRGGLDHANGAKGGHSPATPSMTDHEFMAGVDKVKGHITAGDVYQLVLSIRFTGETDVDPFAAYRALRLLNPSPYMYFVDTGDRQIVGSSPEALARLNGRKAELRPIAGTRPRGADEEEDHHLERELLSDPKEAAEHVMLVDLARNDVGRTAAAGTVVVDPYKTIERYSHVMHMVSGVTADLRPDLDAFDLFAAAFPAGTVSGAPKLRAIEIIDELEPASRGLYSGSIGYFGHGGAMDQAITIRTLVFEQGGYSYQAGAGIVADSNPATEHNEVLSKGAALESALDLAKEGL